MSKYELKAKSNVQLISMGKTLMAGEVLIVDEKEFEANKELQRGVTNGLLKKAKQSAPKKETKKKEKEVMVDEKPKKKGGKKGKSWKKKEKEITEEKEEKE